LIESIQIEELNWKKAAPRGYSGRRTSSPTAAWINGAVGPIYASDLIVEHEVAQGRRAAARDAPLNNLAR
jgi:hypothetical protein